MHNDRPNRDDSGAERDELGDHGMPLCEDALTEHNSQIFLNDSSFVENVIRNDQTQEFHQATFEWKRPSSRSDDEDVLGPLIVDPPSPASPGETLAQVTRLYRPLRTSTALPTQRFLTPGGEDALPLLAKRALSDAGVGYTSLESLDVRTNAARRLAEDLEELKRVTEVASTVRRATSAPQAGKARVHQPARRRAKRQASSSPGGSEKHDTKLPRQEEHIE